MLEKKVQYMKWVKVQTFKRFVLWKNIQVGRYECFWPEIDPNLIVDKEKSRFGKDTHQTSFNIKMIYSKFPD